ncbi:FkbM family methyltransferase [Pedobacter sp. UYP30]|uniref:FkbM family methyltransferase n=1 Tax=Pedobacter sp. UYP30 TaxID=1756400 RepID=UPI003392AE7D
MSLKLIIGRLINNFIIKLYDFDYRLLNFIPNGRYLNLDLKRASISIDNIFDVGANTGQTSLGFVNSFPKSRIFTFEPVASTFSILAKNTTKFPQIKNFNIALGHVQERLSIINQNDSETNSLKSLVSPDDVSAIMINVSTGTLFCEENNITTIDILKIDTEGFEMNVLMGFDKLFLEGKVKCIYAEVGFDRNDNFKTMFTDIEAYLNKLGFLTSGFYEPYRWGNTKLRLGFCNVLFINTNLIQN